MAKQKAPTGALLQLVSFCDAIKKQGPQKLLRP
jgi:uncharacterized protein (DUF3820 family)